MKNALIIMLVMACGTASLAGALEPPPSITGEPVRTKCVEITACAAVADRVNTTAIAAMFLIVLLLPSRAEPVRTNPYHAAGGIEPTHCLRLSRRLY